MEYKINRFGVGIEIALGSDTQPPHDRRVPNLKPSINQYWYRVNFKQWKPLNLNVAQLTSNIQKCNNKEELLKILN